MLNQIEESFSNLALAGIAEVSGILFVLYAHLSHLSICTIIFLLIFSTAILGGDNFSVLHNLASAYWHLVELVWLIILAALFDV